MYLLIACTFSQSHWTTFFPLLELFFSNTLDLIWSLILPQIDQPTALCKKIALWFSLHSCGCLVLVVQLKPEIFQYQILSKHSEISFSCHFLGALWSVDKWEWEIRTGMEERLFSSSFLCGFQSSKASLGKNFWIFWVEIKRSKRLRFPSLGFL